MDTMYSVINSDYLAHGESAYKTTLQQFKLNYNSAFGTDINLTWGTVDGLGCYRDEDGAVVLLEVEEKTEIANAARALGSVKSAKKSASSAANGKLGGKHTSDTRYYYAAHSYMGLNYTYDSPCWVVYAFQSKTDRDQWVSDNEYSQDTGNYVAEAVTYDTACKIAPELRREKPGKAHRTQMA